MIVNARTNAVVLCGSMTRAASMVLIMQRDCQWKLLFGNKGRQAFSFTSTNYALDQLPVTPCLLGLNSLLSLS